MTLARYRLLGSTIALCVAAVIFRSVVIGPNPMLGAILGLVVMFGLLGFAFADWKLMDEFSRQANTIACYWGVIAGIVFWAIALSVAALRLGPDHVLWIGARQGSLAVFVFGGLTTIMVQAVCAFVGLGLWRLAKR